MIKKKATKNFKMSSNHLQDLHAKWLVDKDKHHKEVMLNLTRITRHVINTTNKKIPYQPRIEDSDDFLGQALLLAWKRWNKIKPGSNGAEIFGYIKNALQWYRLKKEADVQKTFQRNLAYPLQWEELNIVDTKQNETLLLSDNLTKLKRLIIEQVGNTPRQLSPKDWTIIKKQMGVPEETFNKTLEKLELSLI